MEAIVLVEFKDKETLKRYKVGEIYKGTKERVNILAEKKFVEVQKEIEPIVKKKTSKK